MTARRSQLARARQLPLPDLPTRRCPHRCLHVCPRSASFEASENFQPPPAEVIGSLLPNVPAPPLVRSFTSRDEAKRAAMLKARLSDEEAAAFDADVGKFLALRGCAAVYKRYRAHVHGRPKKAQAALYHFLVEPKVLGPRRQGHRPWTARAPLSIADIHTLAASPCGKRAASTHPALTRPAARSAVGPAGRFDHYRFASASRALVPSSKLPPPGLHTRTSDDIVPSTPVADKQAAVAALPPQQSKATHSQLVGQSQVLGRSSPKCSAPHSVQI